MSDPTRDQNNQQNHTSTLPLNGEPRETDPCMADDDTLPKSSNPGLKDTSRGDAENYMDEKLTPSKAKYFEIYIERVSQRTGLDRRGVVVASCVAGLLVALVIVVIALAAAWPRVPHRFRYPVCGEGGCLRAAAQISESLNKSVSPCEDLWQSVCGGWLKKNRLPPDASLWNPKQQLVRSEAERVRDLISTLPVRLQTQSVEWKLKHLYDGCMDVENIKNDDVSGLKNIITELGGWVILRDFVVDEFDRNRILTSLHEKFGVSPFFKISVEPNPHTPGAKSIRISPSGLGLPDKEYYFRESDDRIQVAYKEFIRDVVIYLSTTRNEATKFGNDMFSYEKRIAEITPDRVSLQNPITTYNPISLQELKDTNLIPFYDILQAMYPEADISENTEVIVTSVEYLSQVAQIIATTDSRTLNGYLIWTLVRNYMPYLSEKYTSALDNFNVELYGIQKPMRRWEFCSRLLKNYMGIATEILLDRNDPVDEQSKKVLKETFKSILNVAKERIKIFQGTALLYDHLKQKLANLNLQIGIPNYAKNETYLKNYYQKLKIIKLHFFESVKNSITFRKQQDEKQLTNAQESNILEYAVETSAESNVLYVPSENAIYIPRSLLTNGYFENSYPRSIIYGRLGVEIAEAVVSAIVPYGSLWTSNKNLLSPFHMTVNESLRTVTKSTSCIKNYVGSLNLDIAPSTLNDTSINTLKHLSAVSIANEALLKSLDENYHIHQPGLEEYEDTALFFISYAQTQCSQSSSQHRLYDSIVNFELPQKSLLHIAWAQIPQFSRSFDCRLSKKVQCRDIL